MQVRYDIPKNKLNKTVDAHVIGVYSNYDCVTVKVAAQINKTTQVILYDKVYRDSQYQTNEEKKDDYYSLFHRARVGAFYHLADAVDLDKYDYKMQVELCKSKRGTEYFVIKSYERVPKEATND